MQLGDTVIMDSYETTSWQEDCRAIPLGATGTVVYFDHQGFDDDEETEQFVAVNWDTHHRSDYGDTYAREFYYEEDDEYRTHDNVWYVGVNSLRVISSNQTADRRLERIITKIKAIEEKTKNRQLKLRKVKPIRFPDKLEVTPS